MVMSGGDKMPHFPLTYVLDDNLLKGLCLLFSYVDFTEEGLLISGNNSLSGHFFLSRCSKSDPFPRVSALICFLLKQSVILLSRPDNIAPAAEFIN